jgi:hypothetical protein
MKMKKEYVICKNQFHISEMEGDHIIPCRRSNNN